MPYIFYSVNRPTYMQSFCTSDLSRARLHWLYAIFPNITYLGTVNLSQAKHYPCILLHYCMVLYWQLAAIKEKYAVLEAEYKAMREDNKKKITHYMDNVAGRRIDLLHRKILSFEATLKNSNLVINLTVRMSQRVFMVYGPGKLSCILCAHFSCYN